MNNNEIYITALDKLNKAKLNRARSSNTIKYRKQIKQFTAKDYHNKKIKQIKNEKAVEDKFVTYIIEEKTHFANFNLSEDYYSQRLQENYNRFNSNQFKLEEKRKEYDEVVLSIENDILEKYKLDSKNLERYYENHIGSTNQKIKIKEHEFECYQNAYKRLYKFNYFIKKRLEDEHQFQETNDRQFEKYIILKNSALLSAKKQGVLLHNFKQFNEKSEQIYEKEFNNKTNEYAYFKQEVEDIQNQMKTYEEYLQSTRQQQTKTKKFLRSRLDNYQKGLKEYRINYNEFTVLRAKLAQLFHYIKSKDLNSFVVEINKLRQVNQSQKLQYDKINEYITELLLNQSDINNQLKQFSIKTTQRQAINDHCINIKDSNDIVNGKIKEINNQNQIISNKIEHAQKALNISLLFMFDYIYKLSRLSINNTIDEFDSLCHCIEIYPKYFMIKKHNPHLFLDNITYDNELFKFTFCLCKILFKYFMLSLYNTFDPCAQKIFNNENQVSNNQMLSEQLESQSEINNNDQFILGEQIYFNSNDNANAIDEEIDHLKSDKPTNSKAIIQQRKNSIIMLIQFSHEDIIDEYKKKISVLTRRIEMRKKAINRNDSMKEIQLLQQYQEANKQKPQNSSMHINRETSSNNLYKSYLDYLDKEKEKNQSNPSIKMNKTFFELYPHKSLTLINKYSTHLIKNDYNNKSIKKTTAKKQIKKHSETRNKEIRKKIINDENSYEETYQCDKKNTDKHNKKEKLFGSSFSSERVLLYFRINDLRKLEMNYFQHDNRDSVQCSNYNEMYFQFKKKFNKTIEKIKRKNSVVRNSIDMSLIDTKNRNNSCSINPNQNASKKIIKESKSLNYPQLTKSMSNISAMSSSLKDMISTTKTMFIKGRNYDNSVFNLTHRLASLDSTNNFTYINAFMPNKEVKEIK